MAALEDKIVQRATAAVLSGIYEAEFLGFSYGFRPKRSQHDALDALVVGITRTYLKIADRALMRYKCWNDLIERRAMGAHPEYFPEEHIADGRPGRKPVPTRRVLEAVLWILNTGAQWHMLPQSYPNYKTVHRRFQSWCHSEVLRQILTDVANELRDKGGAGRRRELH